MTRRVGLLGTPLKRRHSQVMHDAAFDAAGIDARYVLLELDPDAVEGAVAAARVSDEWLGLGVTAPYKQVVAGLVDEVEPEARAIGAVNNVVRTDEGRLIGFNTDAPGFRAGAELAMGRSLDGTDVVVMGAGGAAHAVVFACLDAGARSVVVANRSVDRAAALVERFAEVGQGSLTALAADDPSLPEVLAAADLAVNATTVGMLDPGATIPVEWLRSDATVFDLVYVPAETPLVAAARARGLRAANGSEMLIAQAAIAFERWTGIGGMADVMRQAVAPLLAEVHGPGLTAMRLATILVDGRPRPAVVRDDDRVLPIDTRTTGLAGVRAIAAGGPAALERLRSWLEEQPAGAGTPLANVTLGPAVPDPGAIYTVGLNYDGPGAAPRPERPLIYGKAAGSVAGHGATLAWDRDVTDDVDAEIELGVVIGAPAFRISAAEAMGHVFGYTCINDVSARDERLDGDQWLLGKSMPGFCPLGPWIVTADAFDPSNVGLRCTIDGEPIQEGRTSQMRHGIADVIAYLSQHVELRPGDLIATGTPPRLASPPGPERRLRAGDTVTVSVEGIGRLTTTIA